MTKKLKNETLNPKFRPVILSPKPELLNLTRPYPQTLHLNPETDALYLIPLEYIPNTLSVRGTTISQVAFATDYFLEFRAFCRLFAFAPVYTKKVQNPDACTLA
jgi:hypothetical protein